MTNRFHARVPMDGRKTLFLSVYFISHYLSFCFFLFLKPLSLSGVYEVLFWETLGRLLAGNLEKSVSGFVKSFPIEEEGRKKKKF